MTDYSDILKLEMFRRKWDKDKRTWTKEDTGNIIVTMKGNQIKQKIELWDNTFHVKVRPFITQVKQCYKCFRFGHIKAWCKSQEKCINCSGLKQDRTREIYTRPQHCLNCGGEHKST